MFTATNLKRKYKTKHCRKRLKKAKVKSKKAKVRNQIRNFAFLFYSLLKLPYYFYSLLLPFAFLLFTLRVCVSSVVEEP